MAYPFANSKRKAACTTRQGKDTPMKENHISGNESKGIFYDELEQFARAKIRAHLQDLLEQEVTEWLGRERSERKMQPLEQQGYRNGYGRPRRFTMRGDTYVSGIACLICAYAPSVIGRAAEILQLLAPALSK